MDFLFLIFTLHFGGNASVKTLDIMTPANVYRVELIDVTPNVEDTDDNNDNETESI